MTVRGRILALSLIEKTAKNPEYAKHIGVNVYMKETNVPSGLKGGQREKKNS